MRLTYKLVIEKDGQTTEEPYENYEAMLERVKGLTAPETAAAEPAKPAEPAGDQTTSPVDPAPPADPVNQA